MQSKPAQPALPAQQQPDARVAISAKFPSLAAFLRSVDAAECEKIFTNARVLLRQLPALSRSDLKELGVPLGPALRILEEACKYSAA